MGGGGHSGDDGSGGGKITGGGGEGGGRFTTGGGDAGTGHGFSHSLHIVHDIWSLDMTVVVVFVVDVAAEEIKRRRRVEINESNILKGGLESNLREQIEGERVRRREEI